MALTQSTRNRIAKAVRGAGALLALSMLVLLISFYCGKVSAPGLDAFMSIFPRVDTDQPTSPLLFLINNLAELTFKMLYFMVGTAEWFLMAIFARSSFNGIARIVEVGHDQYYREQVAAEIRQDEEARKDAELEKVREARKLFRASKKNRIGAKKEKETSKGLITLIAGIFIGGFFF